MSQENIFFVILKKKKNTAVIIVKEVPNSVNENTLMKGLQ
jgi:hypothetical protein